MPDIFLSYSRDDQKIARQFASGLEREGFSVWWDQSLKAGEAFDRVTEKALDDAVAVVVLWSARSVESRWVRAEATQAYSTNRLVPVMIEPCRRPILFELTHTAELADWDSNESDPRWRSFIEGLRTLIAQHGTASATSSTSGSLPPPTGAASRWRRVRRKRVSWLLAAGLAGLAAIAGALTIRQLGGGAPPPRSNVPLHVSLAFDSAPATWPMGTRQIAVAPDGSRVAFAGTEKLWIRALNSVEPVVVEISCSDPFFSPDNTWLGCFKGNGGLVKVPVSGGSPTRLMRTADRPAGASWGRDGQILFATTDGLYRIAAGGGEPQLVAKPDAARGERSYNWPFLLPGGRSALLTVLSRLPDTPPKLVMLDFASGKFREVMAGGTDGRYLPSGHLVYAVGRAPHAIRFDPASGTTRGASVALPNISVDVAVDNGAVNFDIAMDGTLVSLPPRSSGSTTALSWVEVSGRETVLPLAPGSYVNARPSPDGKRLAMDRRVGGNRDVWIADLDRISLSRLTSELGEDILPVWSPDGQRVYFSSNRGGNFDIYSQAADGSGQARLELAAPDAQLLQGITPDGLELLVTEGYNRVSVVDLARHTLRPLLHGDSTYWLATVSPDGRWIAYESNESGDRMEIYLRPYPAVDGRREEISTEGGRYPAWGPAGSNALYFINLKGEMMRTEVGLAPALKVGATRKVFDFQPPPNGISGGIYAVSQLDGRFLIVRTQQAKSSDTTQAGLVLNWLGELQRLLP
jgi:TIR domain/WD40-like Beta Propeller Repeat